MKTIVNTDRNAPKDITPLTISAVCSLENIKDLETEWRDLETRVNRDMGLFQSFEWNLHWCQNWFDTVNNNGAPFITV